MTDAARMHDVTPETRRIVDLVLDYSRERLLAQDTPLDKPLPAVADWFARHVPQEARR